MAFWVGNFNRRITTWMLQCSNCFNISPYSPTCISNTLLGKCNFPEVVCSMVSIIYFVADGGHLNCAASRAFVSANCWHRGRVPLRLPAQICIRCTWRRLPLTFRIDLVFVGGFSRVQFVEWAGFLCEMTKALFSENKWACPPLTHTPPSSLPFVVICIRNQPAHPPGGHPQRKDLWDLSHCSAEGRFKVGLFSTV